MKTSPTPVVSDADVLIHMAKLRRLPLLRVLYEYVSISEYVRQEITSENDLGITEAIGAYLIVHPASPEKAAAVAAQHGIHIGGEGGEYESLVLDCPLFSKKIHVVHAETNWDEKSRSGTFDIKEIRLIDK